MGARACVQKQKQKENKISHRPAHHHHLHQIIYYIIHITFIYTAHYSYAHVLVKKKKRYYGIYLFQLNSIELTLKF